MNCRMTLPSPKSSFPFKCRQPNSASPLHVSSVAMARQAKTNAIQSSAVMPQVGTELYALAKEKGYLRMDFYRVKR